MSSSGDRVARPDAQRWVSTLVVLPLAMATTYPGRCQRPEAGNDLWFAVPPLLGKHD
jgi:hypothetical protein